MGPTLILDKSAFQSLNPKEVRFLYRHFCVSIPDILIREIVADLTKAPGESEYRVSQMVGKFTPLSLYFQAPYAELCISNLLGNPYPMDGRIAMMGGRQVVDEDGSKGVIFDPDPKWDLIRKWEEGVFSEEDVVFSKKWRESLSKTDWQGLISKKKYDGVSNAKSLEELYLELFSLYSGGGAKRQLSHINACLDQFDVTENEKNQVVDRFLDSGCDSFQQYANYAFYFFLVNHTFTVGMFKGLASTRSSSFLDLEYLYYLPFCHVFVTNDSFQFKLANIFKGSHSTIIKGTDLKTGLADLVAKYEALSEPEKREYEYHFGSHPPLDHKSVISDIWKRYCKPWSPNSGNLAGKTSPEEARKIIEKMKSRIAQSQAQKPPP